MKIVFEKNKKGFFAEYGLYFIVGSLIGKIYHYATKGTLTHEVAIALLYTGAIAVALWLVKKYVSIRLK